MTSFRNKQTTSCEEKSSESFKETSDQVDLNLDQSNSVVNKSLPDLGYESLHSTPKTMANQTVKNKFYVNVMNANNSQTNQTTIINENINTPGSIGLVTAAEIEDVLTDHRDLIVTNKYGKLCIIQKQQTNFKKPNQCQSKQIYPIKMKTREKWDKKIDFLLSIIGFAVDLANVWRFPYLCYKNGGGVFLIPYTLLLFLGALPLFFLELAVGQYFKAGPITVWTKINPAWKGIGYCAVLISWYVSFYYNVIIGWTFYYFWTTITSDGLLPWQHCNNTWNTENCISIMDLDDKCKECVINYENRTSAAQEFYELKLLEIDKSSGFNDLGSFKPELVLCMIFTFSLLYFSLFKGVKSSGKVVWVTATAPYFILTILLIRGVFLEGAGTGILYYLEPRFEKLFEPMVWTEAAMQVFFSVGVGFGVHLTYASFNEHKNNCLQDALITTFVNSFTSFYSGFVIFIYLGYIAGRMGKSIDKVAKEGYGLVFQVYPEAISTLPYAKFWCAIFFLMLITLGLDSAMGGLEAVITGLMDEFQFKKLKREVFTVIILFFSFIISLVNVTQGGGYTMLWFDTYSAGVSLLCSAMFEAVAIVYFYGLDQFCLDIESMFDYKPSNFWKLCWKYISPLFLMSIILLSIYQATLESPSYGDYQFSLLSVILGWVYSFSSVLPIPIIYAFFKIQHKLRCRKKVAKKDLVENDINTKETPVFV